jgi:hypothetical protein
MRTTGILILVCSNQMPFDFAYFDSDGAQYVAFSASNALHLCPRPHHQSRNTLSPSYRPSLRLSFHFT